ncbi:MAG TPA: hypothetical protein VG010_10980, partial [Solirubrobacteraceae bacterium]|nr:hypothetical protein [Solirubrobacteraceae bacterium]
AGRPRVAHAPLGQLAHAPAGTAKRQAHAPAGTAKGQTHAPAGTDEEPGRANGTGAERQKRKPRAKGPSKNRLSHQQKAERAVEEAEAALRALEDELADPAAWATQYESAKSQARHTAATRAVEHAYASLEALSD